MHHKLQALRLSKGLTKQQLAQDLKVSTQTISSLENGLLIKIALFFNVSMDCLLGYRNMTNQSVDQIQLLDYYNSLDNIYKGRLLERASRLAEESNTHIKKNGLLELKQMLFM